MGELRQGRAACMKAGFCAVGRQVVNDVVLSSGHVGSAPGGMEGG